MEEEQAREVTNRHAGLPDQERRGIITREDEAYLLLTNQEGEAHHPTGPEDKAFLLLVVQEDIAVLTSQENEPFLLPIGQKGI